jgi:hypothetical protein
MCALGWLYIVLRKDTSGKVPKEKVVIAHFAISRQSVRGNLFGSAHCQGSSCRAVNFRRGAVIDAVGAMISLGYIPVYTDAFYTTKNLRAKSSGRTLSSQCMRLFRNLTESRS